MLLPAKNAAVGGPPGKIRPRHTPIANVHPQGAMRSPKLPEPSEIYALLAICAKCMSWEKMRQSRSFAAGTAKLAAVTN